jgi:hypothetical protein
MSSLRQTISAIKNLRWASLGSVELQQVMVLSGYAALGFAESLRLACELYPESENLRKVAAGELQTTNLRFDGFTGPGDHAHFLWHFIRKHQLAEKCPRAVIEAGERYLAAVRALAPEVRAMSIFSRERELPDIFSEILKAQDWTAPGLPAYRYYLDRHVLLDSQPCGHGDLLAGFPVDESVAEFYEIRLDLYRCVPMLFG